MLSGAGHSLGGSGEASLTAAPSSGGFKITTYQGHDSERGGWRARPAVGVWAHGASRRAGPAAEARPAPEPSPAAPRGDGLAAAVPRDSVTAAGRAASGPSPGAPRDDELAAAPPLGPVTAGMWLAPEPGPRVPQDDRPEAGGPPHDPWTAGG